MFETIDYIILGVIGLSVITGIFRGFVKESVALVVWIVAIWCAYHYANTIEIWFKSYIDDASVRTIISFIAILIVVVVLGAILNALLSFVLHKTGLSGTDRFLGMLFGFVRGVFIVALIILVLNMTSMAKKEDYAHHSVLYTKFDPLVHWLSSMMPSLLKQASLFDKEEDESTTSKKGDLVLNPA